MALAPSPSGLASDYALLARSFRRSLLASNRSPKTIRIYCEAVDFFGRFLTEQGMPTNVAGISREHVEAFVTDQLARWKPATALARYKGLKQFFKWLEEEGEITTSPMARMSIVFMRCVRRAARRGALLPPPPPCRG